MKQPPRLLDDPSIAPELRGDLSRAGSAEPAYDVAVGLVALQAAIVASAAAPAASTAAAQATAGATATGKGALSAVSAKVAIAALGTAVVVAAATAVWPKPASTPRAPVPVQHVTSRAPQPVAPAAPDAPQAAPAPAPAVPSTQALPARTAQTHALRDDDADLRREIAQLGRIKALVDRDPNQAYRLALQGDREFRRGMLQQERSALAIVALSNAGRTSEATRRAQAFLARYPNSPSRERVERLLRGEQE